MSFHVISISPRNKTMANKTQIAINRASSLVLRPLIRMLINFGVPLSDFVEIIKRVYVDVAREQLENMGKRVTDSSISVMTGVHRTDVKRIEDENSGSRPPLVQPSLLESVIRVWSGDMRFITKAGKPRNLKRRRIGVKTKSGETPTFEDLIEEVTKGVPPKALLDEWIRLGAVSVNARGDVCYDKPDCVAGQEVQQLTRSMIATGDRFQAALDALLSQDSDKFVFFVRASHIRKSELPKLTEYAVKLLKQTADRINVRVTEAEERGRKDGGTERFSVGVHVYNEPMARLEKYGFQLW
jgi:Family of unknown function (DUF6502)